MNDRLSRENLDLRDLLSRSQEYSTTLNLAAGPILRQVEYVRGIATISKLLRWNPVAAAEVAREVVYIGLSYCGRRDM